LDAAGLRPAGTCPAGGRYRAMEPAHTRILAKNLDLFAVCIGEDEVGDYNVTEAGWYAVDDGEKVVLGPFASLDECERAMKDRERLLH
jgi:hypothetical protein